MKGKWKLEDLPSLRGSDKSDETDSGHGARQGVSSLLV